MSETLLIFLLYLLLLGRVLIHFRPKTIRDRGTRRLACETADSFIHAGVWALILINLVVRNFYIPSGSMIPTLLVHDSLLVNKFIYRVSSPNRGDIIVFRPPIDPNRDFIKRVIGLEHDLIEVRDGVLYRNGLRVDEPYLNEALMNQDMEPVRVPEGELFMMGDNRNNSNDSRFWGGAPVKDVVGKATVIIYPPTRWRWIHTR